MHAVTGTCVECLGQILLALSGPTLALRSLLFRLTCFSSLLLPCRLPPCRSSMAPHSSSWSSTLSMHKRWVGALAAPWPIRQLQSLWPLASSLIIWPALHCLKQAPHRTLV